MYMYIYTYIYMYTYAYDVYTCMRSVERVLSHVFVHWTLVPPYICISSSNVNPPKSDKSL